MISDLSLTILVDEKTRRHGLCVEHGFSIWIEAGGRRILFDTGQGTALRPNSESLGIDLSAADFVILSHGHYDHTGGLSHVLRDHPDVPVYCHPDAVLTRYSRHGDGSVHDVGISPHSRDAFARAPARAWITQPTRLSTSIHLTGPVPRNTAFEDTGGDFYLDDALRHRDPITDDQSMWIETEAGAVVITGCCHAGIVNTVNHITGLRRGIKIRAVIGGLHLLNASKRRLEATMDAMAKWSPELIVPCHCTGEGAMEALESRFGDAVRRGVAGMSIGIHRE